MNLRLLAITALGAGLLATAPPARAGDLWRGLAVTDDEERVRREYDAAMLAADDAVAQAKAAEITSVRVRLIDRAIAGYEQAARVRPADPEPHFRAASILRAFFLDCGDAIDARRQLFDPDCDTPITPARAARLIEHWDAFERLAPGDPRIGEDILFERAVLRTKLGTEDDLRAASEDYRKLIELRADGPPREALGNLAETYMMLGDLDRAIETYRLSLAHGADLSQEYGLAVALDRDEQGTEARALLQGRGLHGFQIFQAELASGRIFFVPPGEELYYLALGLEALGAPGEAIGAWEGFIASGAHPQFADRARQNRDALLRALPDRSGGARGARRGRTRPLLRWSP